MSLVHVSDVALVDKRGRIVTKKRTSSDYLIAGIALVMFVSTVYFLGFVVVYKWHQVNLGYIQGVLGEMAAVNTVPFDQVGMIFSRLVNTILLAFLTTLVGCMIAFPLSLLAARNLAPMWLSRCVKGFAALIRAVPTIIWVLIFVAGFGLSATTAVIGMTFHTVSFFIKAFSAAFEEVDVGVIDALKSTGATQGHIIFGAVVPSAFSKVMSWIATRTEINFAVAVVIGPAVGVPHTIGTAINVFLRTSNFPAMTLAVLAVFMVALLFETVINRLKQRELVT